MSSFVFIGGDPAIDFLNTEVMRDGAPVDLLQTSDDVWRWLAEAKLSGRDVRSPLQLAAVRQLRAAARRLILTLARGGRTKRDDVDAINAALARGRGSFQLSIAKGEVQTHFRADANDPLFLIASALADFLATKDVTLVKACQGTNCVLLFHDTTKSHTRRWCSMAGCGNRMKAALHYARSRIT